jgi:hypothetical protein
MDDKVRALIDIIHGGVDHHTAKRRTLTRKIPQNPSTVRSWARRSEKFAERSTCYNTLIL